jgi:hypothetical protein
MMFRKPGDVNRTSPTMSAPPSTPLPKYTDIMRQYPALYLVDDTRACRRRGQRRCSSREQHKPYGARASRTLHRPTPLSTPLTPKTTWEKLFPSSGGAERRAGAAQGSIILCCCLPAPSLRGAGLQLVGGAEDVAAQHARPALVHRQASGVSTALLPRFSALRRAATAAAFDVNVPRCFST